MHALAVWHMHMLTGRTSTQEAQRELRLRFNVDAAGRKSHIGQTAYSIPFAHILSGLCCEEFTATTNTRRSYTPCHCCTNYVVMLRSWI